MLKYGQNLFNNISGIKTNDNKNYIVDQSLKIRKIKAELSNTGAPIMYLILDHSDNIICGIPSNNVTKVYFEDIEKESTERKIEKGTTNYAGSIRSLYPNTYCNPSKEFFPIGTYGPELITPFDVTINNAGNIDAEKIAKEISDKASELFNNY